MRWPGIKYWPISTAPSLDILRKGIFRCIKPQQPVNHNFFLADQRKTETETETARERDTHTRRDTHTEKRERESQSERESERERSMDGNPIPGQSMTCTFLAELRHIYSLSVDCPDI